jgi:HTH-type transcriptional regulator / antitoxin HigA
MTTVLADPAEMIRRGAPRLIHNDRELAAYTAALFDLTAKAKPTPYEEEAIELITLLIEQYESARYPLPDAEPVDVLRFLLEHNGLSQRDISSELGSETTVSLILSGKRRLNHAHIERLSRRFNVSPAVFFGKPMTLDEAIKIVLLGRRRHTATTREISEEIRQRGLYLRSVDGEPARASQINARVRQHPDKFEFVQPGLVRLLRKGLTTPETDKAA